MPAQVVPNEVSAPSHDTVETADNPVGSLARFAASTGASLTSDLFSYAKTSARAKCLLQEATRKGDGFGPVVSLDEYCSKLLVVTLGITDVVERTGLTVSIWGSSDQNDWGSNPLVTFRQRQYCGVYSVLLNLARHNDTRYLRVQWNMNLWGKGARIPQFGFEVFLEESGARVSGTAVA